MRTSEPAFGTNFFGSRQIAPRLSTSNEASDASSRETGPLKPLQNVSTSVGLSGSRALIQCFMKSANRNLPFHFSGHLETADFGTNTPPTMLCPSIGG